MISAGLGVSGAVRKTDSCRSDYCSRRERETVRVLCTDRKHYTFKVWCSEHTPCASALRKCDSN